MSSSRAALRLVPVLVLVVSATACGTMYRPEYQIAIETVEVLGHSTAGQVAETSPASFQDDWIRTDWRVTNRDLDVEVRSVAGEPLRVRWDLATFFGVDGSSHPVTRRDVQGATVASLQPGSVEKLSLYPADSLVWEKDEVVDWKNEPLIPDMPGIAHSERARAEAFGRQQVGSSFKLDLPVESDAEKRVYRIVFSVKGATVAEILGT